MTTFFVVLRRLGPHWDPSRPLEEQTDWPAHASFMDELVDSGFVVLGGPLADERRVVLVVDAESADAVRATLARDPWHDTHLEIDTIDRWTIRLDGRAWPSPSDGGGGQPGTRLAEGDAKHSGTSEGGRE